MMQESFHTTMKKRQENPWPLESFIPRNDINKEILSEIKLKILTTTVIMVGFDLEYVVKNE